MEHNLTCVDPAVLLLPALVSPLALSHSYNRRVQLNSGSKAMWAGQCVPVAEAERGSCSHAQQCLNK